jgi:alkylated DNA repair dioxygenase AlkB
LSVNLLYPSEADVIPPIPGLSYRPEYITPGEEQALVTAIDAATWNTSWERRRQPYGVSYGPQSGARLEIPIWGRTLIERMQSEGVCDRPFDQMLVNEYLPGQGISLHHDYLPFGHTVASLSLLAPCVMDFRHAGTQRREWIWLAPRSLLVLADEARYEWQHGIARRKADRCDGVRRARARRISVTFRWLQAGHDEQGTVT